MPAVFRPRRSLLYTPGSNPRALEKARGLPADGLIIDLEDAVAADAKETARAIAAAALAAGGFGLGMGGDDAARPFDLFRARRVSKVGRRDLLGVDQRLAVKTELAALPAGKGEALVIR